MRHARQRADVGGDALHKQHGRRWRRAFWHAQRHFKLRLVILRNEVLPDDGEERDDRSHAAKQRDTPHAIQRFKLFLDVAAGNVRRFNEWARRRDGRPNDWRRVDFKLLDGWRLDGSGWFLDDEIHLIPDFLSGDIEALVGQKLDVDLRDTFHRRRANLVDAADGVDGRLDLFGNIALSFNRRSDGVGNRHGDNRKANIRKLINVRRPVAKNAVTVITKISIVAKTRP